MNIKPILTALALTAAAHAGPSTFGEGDSYAWGANIGWLEFIPHRPSPGDGVAVTDTCLGGFAWSDSTGWINFGDGTPANGVRYSNTTGADSGVNHDGTGNLGGLAWSANLGWINFGWAAAGDPNRPRFDLLTGGFTGFAWSANAGWINLDTGILRTELLRVTDADGDGISDAWEIERTEGTNMLTATGDRDGDGMSDLDEYRADTDPLDPADNFRILDFTQGGTKTILTWVSRPTRLYRISRSTDLTTWQTSDAFAPDGSSETTRQATHEAAPRQFFKVDAVLPLSK